MSEGLGLANLSHEKSRIFIDESLRKCFDGHLPQEEVWLISRNPIWLTDPYWYGHYKKAIKLLRQINRMSILAPHFSPDVIAIPVRIRPHVKIQRHGFHNYAPEYCLDDPDVYVWMRRRIFLILIMERMLKRLMSWEKIFSKGHVRSCRCPGDTSDI